MLKRYKVRRYHFATFSGAILLSAAVCCAGSLRAQADDSDHATSPVPSARKSDADHPSTHKKSTGKKPPAPLPPLPSGPTGPVPQVPLDNATIAPVPPQVTFKDGQLTIVAPNSTLGDILRAVREQTKAEIEIPIAADRVVTHIGPGPVQQVMSELLNGSRFNYVLIGSPEDPTSLTRVVLVAKAKPETTALAGQQQAANQGPNPNHAPAVVDADSQDEDNSDAATEQPVEPEPQPAPSSDEQAQPKTPQQMLQEMQQRQLQFQQQQQQLQQQQQSGQPPQPPPNPPAQPPQQQQ